MNAAGVLTDVATQQVVGQMHGLPVVTDPNIDDHPGHAGNEDPIYVLRAIRHRAVGVGHQGTGLTGDQGAEPHGAVAALLLRRVLGGPLPGQHHRLGPRDVPLEAKRCRHVAVAIPQVRVSRGIAVSPRQQSAQPQQPDVAHHQTLIGWRGR